VTMTGAYDDGESIATPDEDMPADHVAAIASIRRIPDAGVRRALMVLFVLAVLHGRIGR
jgi:hypothetical protein